VWNQSFAGCMLSPALCLYLTAVMMNWGCYCMWDDSQQPYRGLVILYSLAHKVQITGAWTRTRASEIVMRGGRVGEGLHQAVKNGNTGAVLPYTFFYITWDNFNTCYTYLCERCWDIRFIRYRAYVFRDINWHRTYAIRTTLSTVPLKKLTVI
jgi:hypothetical protein